MVTSGRMVNYPLYDAIHKKKQTSQERNQCIRPKFPKSPGLYNRGSQPFSDHVPLTEFYIEFLEFRNYKGRLRFYIS